MDEVTDPYFSQANCCAESSASGLATDEEV